MPVLLLSHFASRNLEPLDLEIPAGGCVTLAGPSGCGKTLLLRAIADLDPHGGEAFLDELAQSSVPAPEWRHRVGMLPAESHWWHERIGEHMTDAPADLLQALALPDDCLSWEVSRTSSGERQRLALVRLLSRSPQALLLDEPTANLDRNSGRLVEETILAYRRRTAAPVLWISHDPEQRCRVGEQSWLIRNGRLEAETWS
jgi:ABC-type iron transport system FetAB ATPase subunit